MVIYIYQRNQGAFPGGSNGKESACNAGDQIPSLGQEDPLEKGMATHSSILAWRIPQTFWWATDHGVCYSPCSCASLILFVTPIVLLFILFPPFAEPRVGKVRARRLEGDSGSCRNRRHVYSPLAGWQPKHDLSPDWQSSRSSSHNKTMIQP